MNKYLLLFVIISIYACNSNINKEKVIPESVEINNSNIEDLLISTPDIYRISFEIDKQKNSSCHLYISVELFDGAYFMSPISNIPSSDSFSVDIEKNDFIKIDSLLTVLPPSAPEYDSLYNKNIYLVKEKTTFKWSLSLQTESDFEVSGSIQFRIYPKSSIETVNYIISQQSGTLNIYRKGHDNKIPTKIMQIRSGATVKGYLP